jgi:hypothetical protein
MMSDKWNFRKNANFESGKSVKGNPLKKERKNEDGFF